jgi:hypothetical protein
MKNKESTHTLAGRTIERRSRYRSRLGGPSRTPSRKESIMVRHPAARFHRGAQSRPYLMASMWRFTWPSSGRRDRCFTWGGDGDWPDDVCTWDSEEERRPMRKRKREIGARAKRHRRWQGREGSRGRRARWGYAPGSLWGRRRPHARRKKRGSRGDGTWVIVPPLWPSCQPWRHTRFRLDPPRSENTGSRLATSTRSDHQNSPTTM